jgi:hypothetical protein
LMLFEGCTRTFSKKEVVVPPTWEGRTGNHRIGEKKGVKR